MPFVPCRTYQRPQGAAEEQSKRCAHHPADSDVGDLRGCATASEIHSGEPRQHCFFLICYAIYSKFNMIAYK